MPGFGGNSILAFLHAIGCATDVGQGFSKMDYLILHNTSLFVWHIECNACIYYRKHHSPTTQPKIEFDGGKNTYKISVVSHKTILILLNHSEAANGDISFHPKSSGISRKFDSFAHDSKSLHNAPATSATVRSPVESASLPPSDSNSVDIRCLTDREGKSQHSLHRFAKL
jgi:hypothetical protein